MLSEPEQDFSSLSSEDQQRSALKILYLDDDPLDHKLFDLYLRRSDSAESCRLTCVSTITDARQELDDAVVDILVLDNRMPNSPNFRATLSRLGALGQHTKIVVVSSEVEDDIFKNLDHLDHKPAAIIDKAELRARVREGFFHTL